MLPALGIVLTIAAAAVGCARREEPPTAGAPDVPYIEGVDFDRQLQTADTPVLVEFCVPSGCFRCDEMRPRINTLAEAEAERVMIRRVDLNAERRLAARLNVTVCPTYVVFADGQETGRAAYPTSADLIAALIPDPH